MTAVTDRPNVLLIMVDQLAAQWLPSYGQAMQYVPNRRPAAD